MQYCCHTVGICSIINCIPKALAFGDKYHALNVSNIEVMVNLTCMMCCEEVLPKYFCAVKMYCVKMMTKI